MKQKRIILEPLDIRFSVCQVSDYSGIERRRTSRRHSRS